MAYTKNPHLPRVRMQAAKLVIENGWSTRQVARHTGFNQSTIVKWAQRARLMSSLNIPTASSRPHHHPNQLSDETVKTILDYRKRYRRCAEVIHHLLLKDGLKVSLSSVKRTLKRNGCTRYSKWKKWHKYPERPKAEKPGILVQIDSILDGIPKDRLCVYTLIDVYSRWTYAKPILRTNTHNSLSFVKEAQRISPFQFLTIQSDHGSEFSKWFTKRLLESGFIHRHSRVRTPSDNGHLERFNRTLQEECLNQVPRSLKSWEKEIPEYLLWYNTKRPHMALNMKTPLEILSK
jgi:transposase InsO family protein